MMNSRTSLAAVLLVFGILVAPTIHAQELLSEDFEGLTLEAFVDETSGGDGTDWTSTPPEGWTVENDLPEGGVTEWRGWSFADVQAWTTAAGDQNRSQFTNAQGVAAIADPDEWDDIDGLADPNNYNTTLNTPSIALNGASAITIAFDSSWRPEDNQKARLEVRFDGGDPIEVFLWTSASGDATFHPDSENESISETVEVPAGASNAVVSFTLFDGGNDWWWAIDNVAISAAQASQSKGWDLYQ